MHFEREALDPVLPGVFRLFLPIGNDSFFPLPILHLRVFGRRPVSDPIRLGILRSAARAAGKTDDDFYLEDFGEEDGLAEGIDVFLGMLGIGMNGVAMTTESGNANSAVFKFFLPGFSFAAVGDEFIERTMTIVRIASRADLHGFETKGGDLVQHSIEGEMVIDRIKHAERNLAQVAGSFGCGKAQGRGLGICRMSEYFTSGDRRREQAARGSQKLSPADGGVLGLFLHARLLDERSI